MLHDLGSDVVLESDSILESDSSPYFKDADSDSSPFKDSDSDLSPQDRLRLGAI